MSCKLGWPFWVIFVILFLTLNVSVCSAQVQPTPQPTQPDAPQQDYVFPLFSMIPLLPFQLETTSQPLPTDRPLSEAPFLLTPEQQAYVDQVLLDWEKYSDQVKTFEANLTLRTYGDLFNNGKPPVPKLGVLKYAKPNKGYFEVRGDELEKWICDGTSLYEYRYLKRNLVQYVFPPDQQGQAIKEGPFPFLFGIKVAALKQRYWIRALPSPDNTKDKIWLQAYPKHAQDAAWFHHAEIIVSAKDMHPIGIQMHMANETTVTSCVFQDVVINENNPWIDRFGDDGTGEPKLPHGWTKVVKQPESAQAGTGQIPRR